MPHILHRPEKTIEKRFNLLSLFLNDKQRRILAAGDLELQRGSIEDTAAVKEGIRKPGGGRKPAIQEDPMLKADPVQLIEPVTR